MEHSIQAAWLSPDELEVVRAFQIVSVRFLIIGGRAVQFHGVLRPAKDLDLLVERTAETWLNLNAALRPLNASVPPFEDLDPLRKYQAKLRFYETVEFLTAIDNVDFAGAWHASIDAFFAGPPVRVLSIEHLIDSKKHSTRQVDIDDVRALNALSS